MEKGVPLHIVTPLSVSLACSPNLTVRQHALPHSSCFKYFFPGLLKSILIFIVDIWSMVCCLYATFGCESVPPGWLANNSPWAAQAPDSRGTVANWNSSDLIVLSSSANMREHPLFCCALIMDIELVKMHTDKKLFKPGFVKGIWSPVWFAVDVECGCCSSLAPHIISCLLSIKFKQRYLHKGKGQRPSHAVRQRILVMQKLINTKHNSGKMFNLIICPFKQTQ